MVTERRYELDGTVYRVLACDTLATDILLAAPDRGWSHAGYGVEISVSAEYIADKLAYRLRATDRANLARCLAAVLIDHQAAHRRVARQEAIGAGLVVPTADDVVDLLTEPSTRFS